MKKIILFSALLILANSVFSQPANPSPALTKQDYLKKSKDQKTAAWIFMGGGIGLAILGFQADKHVEGNLENSGKIVAIVTGLAAISVGTTLFILASENKKRAGVISFRMETAPLIQQRSFVYRSYPALSFRLKL